MGNPGYGISYTAHNGTWGGLGFQAGLFLILNIQETPVSYVAQTAVQQLPPWQAIFLSGSPDFGYSDQSNSNTPPPIFAPS